jgi:hypothetical protein
MNIYLFCRQRIQRISVLLFIASNDNTITRRSIAVEFLNLIDLLFSYYTALSKAWIVDIYLTHQILVKKGQKNFVIFFFMLIITSHACLSYRNDIKKKSISTSKIWLNILRKIQVNLYFLYFTLIVHYENVLKIIIMKDTIKKKVMLR